jgi:hypothetical protein
MKMKAMKEEATMDLKAYFENTKGTGVLATADGDGLVNAAIYARPHVLEGGTLAAIMRDRLSLANLQSNPHAVYLFIEDGPGYRGRRLYLTKLSEDDDPQRIEALSRRKKRYPEGEKRFLVVFRVDRIRPLVGDGEDA